MSRLVTDVASLMDPVQVEDWYSEAQLNTPTLHFNMPPLLGGGRQLAQGQALTYLLQKVVSLHQENILLVMCCQNPAL